MIKYYGYLSESYSSVLQISLFRSYPIILRTSNLSQRDLILNCITQCFFFSLCMFLSHYQEKEKKATVKTPKSLLPLMYSELNSEIAINVFTSRNNQFKVLLRLLYYTCRSLHKGLSFCSYSFAITLDPNTTLQFFTVF